MSVLIKDAEIPTTGLYLVSVDNTNGHDKTVITVERYLKNCLNRRVIGSYELAYIPNHIRLENMEKLEADLLELKDKYDKLWEKHHD